MSKKNHERCLNLEIRNFGPIKEGNFLISPLTVLIGPNNSGKSFVSLLFHSLTSLNLDNYDNLEESLSRADRKFLKELKHYFREELEEDLIKYLYSKPDMDSEPFRLPQDLANELFQKIIHKFFLRQLKDNIEIFFGKNLDKLTLKGEKEFSFSFNEILFEFRNNDIILPDFDFNIESNLEFDDEKDFIKFKSIDGELYFNFNYSYYEKDILSEMNNPNPSDFANKETNEDRVLEFFEVIHNKPQILICSLFSDLMFNLIFLTIIKEFWENNSYYIPVGKTEVVHNLKNIISQNLLDDDHGYSQSQKFLTNDFVTMNYNEKGDFYEIASEMEKKLLNGHIEIDAKNDIPDFYFLRSDDLKVDANNMSSSIAELVPIILYLKHVLKKGDTLILEEPESHINPLNQKILIKYLVKTVNKGLNLLFTTHSDYIIEQINNHIRLFKKSNNANRNKIMKKYGYSESEALNPEKVSVYAFRESNVGKYSYNAHNLNIDDLGIDNEDMIEIINDLYEESDDIRETVER